MSPLAKYIFVFLLNHTGPGESVYSMELMPSCGTDQARPTCQLNPVCITQSPLCAPPRWSTYRSGWVRAETREVAMDRYANAAIALARTATYLTRCKDEHGSVIEECQPMFWPDGPRSAACAMLASSIWESGYREDIMTGAPPMGRGTDGEACVMQVMPQYVAQNVSWLTDEQRMKLKPEQIAQMTLGTDQKSLERCYEAGGRHLSKFRSYARYKCKGDWVYAMYALYGTGGSCYPNTSSKLNQEGIASGGLHPVMAIDLSRKDWAAQRTGTYRKCMDRWPDKEPVPAWARAKLASLMKLPTQEAPRRVATNGSD